MVATLHSISSSSNAGKYFYFTEKGFESSSSFYDSHAKKELGLGRLNKQTLERLLDGKLESGGKLKPNIQLGRKTADGLIHHPGQELILSAPKSVSIIALIAGDERVLKAHEKAVDTTLGYIEEHMIYTRIQKGGNLKLVRTDNAIIAKFTHLTSRPPKTEAGDTGTTGQKGDKQDKGEKKKGGECKKIQDPQVHTHCIIVNATKCTDNVYRSIVFDSLYQNKMHIGQIYRLELARNLQDLGYNINLIRDKKNRFTFEIKGVPEDDIQIFSQRRADILSEALKQGAMEAKDLAFIAKTTRGNKESYNLGDLKNLWTEKATSLDTLLKLTEEAKIKQNLNATTIGVSKAQTHHRLHANSILNYAISHLSEREAVWGEEKLHATMIEKSGITLSICDIKAITKDAINLKKLLTSLDNNQNTLTTLKNFTEEKSVIKQMQDYMYTVRSIMSRADVIARIANNTSLNTQIQNDPITVKTKTNTANPDNADNSINTLNKTNQINHNNPINPLNKNSTPLKLTIGQQDGISLIFTTTDRVIGIQGAAGSGKTTLLNEVRAIASQIDYGLIGIAPTKSAAHTLEGTTDIKSQTLSSFLAKYSGIIANRGSIDTLNTIKRGFQNKIVLLDEASLASTSQVHDLLKLAHKLEFRLVMLGDIYQLGAVSRGKPFYYLLDHGMNTSVMDLIQRQENKQLLKSVYLAAQSVDKPKKEATQKLYLALKALSRNNIIDISSPLSATSNKKQSANLRALNSANHSNNTIDAANTNTINTININNALILATYDKWLLLKTAGHEPLVVVPSQLLRKEINLKLRNHYIDQTQKEISLSILINKGLTNVQLQDGQNYSLGDVLVFHKSNPVTHINKGDYLCVTSIDGNILSLMHKSNDLTTIKSSMLQYDVSLAKKGATRSSTNAITDTNATNTTNAINTYGADFVVYTQQTITLAPGEKIKWTKNSSTLDFVINGKSAVIKSIDTKTKSIVIDIDSSLKSLSLNHSDLQHIDYDYATTAYGAQGKTSHTTLAVIPSKTSGDLISQRSFYVMLSRAKHEVFLITDNYQNLIQKLGSTTGAKTSAIEHQEQSVRYSIQQEDGTETREEKERIKEKEKSDTKNPKSLSDFKSLPRLVQIYNTTKYATGNIKSAEPGIKAQSHNNKLIYDYNTTTAATTTTTTKAYDSFLKDQNKIRDVAIQAFGSINPKLSNRGNLRFGKSGHISLNLDTAMWYDFKIGQGGSLYKLAKDKGLLSYNVTHTNQVPFESKENVMSDANANSYTLATGSTYVKANLPLNKNTQNTNLTQKGHSSNIHSSTNTHYPPIINSSVTALNNGSTLDLATSLQETKTLAAEKLFATSCTLMQTDDFHSDIIPKEHHTNVVSNGAPYLDPNLAQTPLSQQSTAIPITHRTRTTDNVATRYLQDIRKINLNHIKLSQDLRFADRIWSSEDQNYHPALIAIARNAKGAISAAQVTYLDKTSANKDETLSIQKRSQGVLLKSFVELSVPANRSSNAILVAEGVETALSILMAQPDKRVICSLGISNIGNLYLSQTPGDLRNKTLIICADNDGINSTSRMIVDSAATKLSNQGFKNVIVIRPDQINQDFNDILREKGVDAVNRLLGPLFIQHPNYKLKFNQIKNKIDFYQRNIEKAESRNETIRDIYDRRADHRINNTYIQNPEPQTPHHHSFITRAFTASIPTIITQLYKLPQEAQKTLDTLIQTEGIASTLAKIKENPGILGELNGLKLFGFTSQARLKALSHIDQALKDLRYLNLNTKLKTLYLNQYRDLKSSFIDKALGKILTFSTIDTDSNQNPDQNHAFTENQAQNHVNTHIQNQVPLKLDALKSSIEQTVLRALIITDNKPDIKSVSKVTARLAESVVHFRNRFNQEPGCQEKLDFFLRARYELERETYLQNIVREQLGESPKSRSLTNTDNNNNKDTNTPMLERQNLELISAIDSLSATNRYKADKDQIYHTPESPSASSPDEKLLSRYQIAKGRISSKAKELFSQGINPIKANFIAYELVKYEERYGAHMPIKQQEALKHVGDYVAKNFSLLIDSGLTQDQARAAYIEGAQIALNYDHRTGEVSIPESGLKQIQQVTRDAIHKDVATKDVSTVDACTQITAPTIPTAQPSPSIPTRSTIKSAKSISNIAQNTNANTNTTRISTPQITKTKELELEL